MWQYNIIAILVNKTNSISNCIVFVYIAFRCVNSRRYFVPAHQKISKGDVDRLQRFVDAADKLTVLTGAGISTESGIPDYRSAEVGLYARNGYRPMNYSEFIGKHSARQRYWARSFLSWRHFFDLVPNLGHLTLSEWQRAGRIVNVITQNVDRLHHKAGTESVYELHGNLYSVVCIGCKRRTPRILFQTELTRLNAQLLQDPAIADFMVNSNYYQLARPDGDIDVNAQFIEHFSFPYCQACNGILKPDIVFFGDNVDSGLVRQLYELVDKSDALLVLGSSLQVFSSYRFVLHAHSQKKSLLIVNIGPTRADNLSNIVRLNVKIGEILPLIQL